MQGCQEEESGELPDIMEASKQGRKPSKYAAELQQATRSGSKATAAYPRDTG